MRRCNSLSAAQGANARRGHRHRRRRDDQRLGLFQDSSDTRRQRQVHQHRVPGSQQQRRRVHHSTREPQSETASVVATNANGGDTNNGRAFISATSSNVPMGPPGARIARSSLISYASRAPALYESLPNRREARSRRHSITKECDTCGFQLL